MAVYQDAAYAAILPAPITMELFPSTSNGVRNEVSKAINVSESELQKEASSRKRARKSNMAQGALRFEVQNSAPSTATRRFTRAASKVAAAAAAPRRSPRHKEILVDELTQGKRFC